MTMGQDRCYYTGDKMKHILTWLNNNGHYIGKVIIYGLIIIPAIITLLFVIRNGVNAVVGDSWFFVRLFDKLYSGNLTIADMFAQQNEHRVMLPRVIMLTIGTITQYNIKYEMYCNWGFILLSAIVLYRIFKITPALSRMSIAWFIPVTWLMFTLRSVDNFLTGNHMVYFLVVLCFLLSVYFLQICRGTDWRLGAAILSALAGSFTLANGLLIWPIGFLQLLLVGRSKPHGERHSYIVAAAIWLLIAITTFIVYFATFQNTEHVAQQPLESFVYWLAALGNAFYSYPDGAIAIGGILLILFACVGVVIFFDSKNRPDNVPFLALMAFSCATLMMLVLGRPEFSVMSRKYIIIGIIGVVGLYFALLSLKLKFLNPDSLVFKSVIILMLLLIFVENRNLFNGGGGPKLTLDRQLIQYYTTTYQLQSDETLSKAECQPFAVRYGSQTLQKYKLNVFSQPVLSLKDLKKADKETVCIIESVNGSALKEGEVSTVNIAEEDKSIIIRGWAVDTKNDTAAGGVILDIDGKIELPAYYGIPRQDVAEYHNNRNYTYSGFYASIAASTLGPGPHTISIKVISADKKDYYRIAQTLALDLNQQSALILR